MPLNHRGNIIGALALYRREKVRFTDQEFRHLEIVAGQAAIGLHRSRKLKDAGATLFDEVTGLPNGYQMHLMFREAVQEHIERRLKNPEMRERYEKARRERLGLVTRLVESAVKPSPRITKAR